MRRTGAFCGFTDRKHKIMVDRAKGILRPRLPDRRAEAADQDRGLFGGDNVGPMLGRRDLLLMMRRKAFDFTSRENGNGRRYRNLRSPRAR
jgi:hypothetical protein